MQELSTRVWHSSFTMHYLSWTEGLCSLSSGPISRRCVGGAMEGGAGFKCPCHCCICVCSSRYQ